MFYTLSDLRSKIEKQIEEFGESAPVAAFIFTQEDVYDCDGTEGKDDEFLENVMCDLGDSDYIYDTINNVLEDVVKDQLNSNSQS